MTREQLQMLLDCSFCWGPHGRDVELCGFLVVLMTAHEFSGSFRGAEHLGVDGA